MFSHHHRPSLLNRLTAGLGVALVVLLTVLAASPELHAWVHGPQVTAEAAAHGHAPVGDADHDCAVTLFASGVSLLLAFVLYFLARVVTRDRRLWPSDWLIVTHPHYWLVPAHAPPVGLN